MKMPQCVTRGASYICTDPSEKAQVHADHLQALYNTVRPAYDIRQVRSDLAALCVPEQTEEQLEKKKLEDSRPPDLEEVESAVNELRQGKAPGPDDIHPEHVKHAGPKMLVCETRATPLREPLGCIPHSGVLVV